MHWTCKYVKEITNHFGAQKVANALSVKKGTLVRYGNGGPGYERGVPKELFLKIVNLKISQLVS